MANIELNYYNGENYEVLYPKISLNNNNGSVLSASYGGTGVSSISSLASNMKSYFGDITYSKSKYTGTGTKSYSVSCYAKTIVTFITTAFNLNSFGMGVPVVILRNSDLTSSYSSQWNQLVSIQNNGSSGIKYYYITYYYSGNNISITDDGNFYNISGNNYAVLYLNTV